MHLNDFFFKSRCRVGLMHTLDVALFKSVLFKVSLQEKLGMK